MSRPVSEPLPGDAEAQQGERPAATAVKPKATPAAAPSMRAARAGAPARAGATAAGARGAVPGLDKRSAQRLARGQLPIEARLDLHGHTRAEAARALGLFLAGAQAQDKRCVLVITGKGTGERDSGQTDTGEGDSGARDSGARDSGQTDTGEGWPRAARSGVLRAEVPAWLGAPGNRARVIAWNPARPKDGGDGALYVLLRRKR